MYCNRIVAVPYRNYICNIRWLRYLRNSQRYSGDKDKIKSKSTNITGLDGPCFWEINIIWIDTTCYKQTEKKCPLFVLLFLEGTIANSSQTQSKKMLMAKQQWIIWTEKRKVYLLKFICTALMISTIRKINIWIHWKSQQSIHVNCLLG